MTHRHQKLEKLLLRLTLALLVAGGPLWSQDSEEEAPVERVQPIFPRENPNLVFVEGEKAVSTNFNKEPILNFSCSSRRTLQLNSTSDLKGQASYYADYVFTVPEAGEYELWYGGTPAGPLEELYPSFFSPFRFTVDDSESVDVYREDIVVNETYSPSYYWNQVQTVHMEAGSHRIRFEVVQKRRYDGRYYFYLDCFFFVRVSDGERIPGAPVPKVFPADLDDRSIDYPFRAIDDYLIIIRETTDRQEKVSRQVELSMIYSMLGDYLNALKYLGRAAALSPDNPRIMLLQAKNRIWKGDVAEGLDLYRRLLEIKSDALDVWLEAGKIAGWTGRFDDSLEFFEGGLERFEDDVDLLVNLGLTHLWASQAADAQRVFQISRAAAGGDTSALKDLAAVYRINGYAENAIPVYRDIIRMEPADLESYLLLQDTYKELARTDEAEAMRQRIADAFIPSPELDRYLDTYLTKQSLIDQTIAEYEAILTESPDNLQLRQLLAQTYFWNGLLEEALGEYTNILVNHAYHAAMDLETASFDILGLLDVSYMVTSVYAGVTDTVKTLRKELSDGLKTYQRAATAVHKAEAAIAKAQEAEKEVTQEQSATLMGAQDTLFEEEQRLGIDLARAVEYAESLEDSFILSKQWKAELQRLLAADREVQDTFRTEVEDLGWSWDRTAFLLEIQRGADAGLSFAHYILGKVAQIERRLATAEQSYQQLESAEPAYAYARAQTALWQYQTDPEEYVELFASDVSPYAPYLDRLREVATAVAVPPDPSPTYVGEDVSAQITDISSRLNDLRVQAETVRKQLGTDQRAAHQMLRDRMLRALYGFQQKTYELRNELGDFYLKSGNLDSAIVQFRQVLAVDPSNVEAIFLLGNVTQQTGDWYKALSYYRRVYEVDPYHENVINVHNRLAESHADELEVRASYRSDPSHMDWNVSATYRLPLTTLLGVRATYDAGSYRSGEYLINELYSSAATIFHHIAYQNQSITVSVPLDLYLIGLTIAPGAGVHATLDSQYFTGPAGINNSVYPNDDIFGRDETQLFKIGDFWKSHSVYPFGRLDLTFELENVLNVTGSASYGAYPETLAVPKTPRLALDTSLGVSPVLGFIPVAFLQRIYTRSYGRVVYIPADDNIIGLFAQDLVIPIPILTRPSLTLNIEGALYYTDSTITTPTYDYYSPHKALTAKGGLSASLWLPLADSDSIGASIRVLTGYGKNHDIYSGTDIEQVIFEGGPLIRYTRRRTSVSLEAAVNATFDPTFTSLDYWSLVVSAGVSTAAPRLLAPK